MPAMAKKASNGAVGSKAAKTVPKTDKGAETMVKAGRVEKHSKKPVSKRVAVGNKAARMALASGAHEEDEKERRRQMDLRTLYVRFKNKNKLPEGEEAVRKLHSGIKSVRIPRQGTAKKKSSKAEVKYAFIEFGSEAQCEEAKATLEGSKEASGLYLDFVGTKSKNCGKPRNPKATKTKRPINPTRLFLSGLVEGVTEEKLKQLFPKSIQASIPKKDVKNGRRFGFVNFASPADAKAAFDAAQKLTFSKDDEGGSHHLTVLYARGSKSKRKLTEEPSDKTAGKKSKVVTVPEVKSEEEHSDDNNDNDEGESESDDEEYANDEESEEEKGANTDEDGDDNS